MYVYLYVYVSLCAYVPLEMKKYMCIESKGSKYHFFVGPCWCLGPKVYTILSLGPFGERKAT